MEEDRLGRETHVRRGRSEDMPKIIQFADYVFSKAHRPHDFATLLPKLYGAEADTAADHWLVTDVDDQDILAMVYAGHETYLYSPEWRAADASLTEAKLAMRVNGIGTVSVDHRERGKSYMRTLMYHAIQDMKDQGVALSVLGGQRQRYGYYGYEPMASAMTLHVSRTNLTKACGKAWTSETQGLEILPFDSARDELDTLYALYRTEVPITMRTRETFLEVCKTWGTQLYVLRDADRIQGYALVGGGRDARWINEFALSDPKLSVVLCAALLRDLEAQELSVQVPVWQTEAAAELMAIAEGASIEPAGLSLVLDWVQVLRVAFYIKQQTDVLSDGALNLCIQGAPYQSFGATPEPDPCFHIVVEGGVPTIEKGHLSDPEVPSVSLAYAAAISILFTPFGRAMLASLPPEDREPLARTGWFPVPISHLNVDGV